MKKILIYRITVHSALLRITAALLPIYNIAINFFEDEYAYKEEGTHTLVLSVSELAGGILPGLLAIYEWMFVAAITIAVFKMNKDKPYPRFWFNSPFDKEHSTKAIRKTSYGLCIAFAASAIIAIIIRLISGKPVLTECCWAPCCGFGILIYISTMLADISSHLRKNNKTGKEE